MLTYTPESPMGGYAIAAGRRVALLGEDTSADTAREVHRLLADAALPLDEALAAVRESTVCRRFAFVEFTDPESGMAAVAVRGNVRVDLGSASMSRFTWPEGATWVRATAVGAEIVRLSLGETPPDAEQLPFTQGIARASDLIMSPQELVGADASAPGEESGEADDAELTVIMEETLAAVRANADHRAEDEVRRLAGLAPVPPPTLGASAPTSGDVASPGRESRPSRAPQRVDLSAFSRPTAWTLRLPDGNELEAGGSIIVGRKPWRTDPDETSTFYILAPSPGKQISGKHLEFSVVGGELRARDLESTNGTLVITPDHPPRLLADGRSIKLDDGVTLDLGEGFRIVVGDRRRHGDGSAAGVGPAPA